MARRIVRASYTINRPTFGFDMMIPIWKQFAVAGLPSNLPFLFTDAANGHPNPELISGLDPDVETLLIINITVTTGTVVGSLGRLGSDKQTNRLWDPLRTVYRWTTSNTSYVYDKSLTDSVSAEYGWFGASQTNPQFYPEGRVYNFDYDSTEIKTNGTSDVIDIFNLTSLGPGYPFPYASISRNANDWIVKFPVVGTVISNNPTGFPNIDAADPAVTDIVEHQPFPGMNHLNSMAAMHIGVPPSDKWKIQINIKNSGIICGMGGEGGNGADFFIGNPSFSQQILGREYLPHVCDGGPGGDAIDARAGQDPDKTYPADWIRVNVVNLGNGKVFAGGGGGGGGATSQKLTEAFALVPSGSGGGGSAGAGLSKELFEVYWLNYTGVILDAYNTNYRYFNTASFDVVPRWALGGRGGQGGQSFHSFNNGVEESYKGNYNGSAGANGKDPINNNNLDLIGGPGGGTQSGPGAWQATFNDPSFARNVGATWYPGGHKGGKGGNGGDFGLAGSNGGNSVGRQVDPSFPITDLWYGEEGRGGAAGRAAIYSDNVTVNIRSARPRNIKGAKTKIDPV